MDASQKYNPSNPRSIVAYAKRLKNKTLRQVCVNSNEQTNIKNKGGFGQFLEEFYFGYSPNSNSEPDFPEAGLELKASPLKVLKNGEIRSKERLVLNIINYLKVYKEDFYNSSFFKKNAHLLLVFYLYEKDKHFTDYYIKLIEDWKYPSEDLAIIRQDWQIINQKIKEGKAHELSEGDTFYLGACTKGSTALTSLRNQPFSNEKAKQRAYSLKQGYVNHIIATISQDETEVYGKILNQITHSPHQSLEAIILEKFKAFYGKSAHDICGYFGLTLNPKSKNYYASLTKQILGIELDKKIAEFEKADIVVKTIRVESNDKIQQSVSFPAFKYEDIARQDWEDSCLKNRVEQKFLFIFYKNDGMDYKLDKVVFWNMPYTDRLEVERVWLKTQQIINNGTIFKDYSRDKEGNIRLSKKGNKIKENNFPKIKDSSVCHVRPHGADSKSTYPLPVPDVTLNTEHYSKQCFWLNSSYVRDEIYLKNQ